MAERRPSRRHHAREFRLDQARSRTETSIQVATGTHRPIRPTYPNRGARPLVRLVIRALQLQYEARQLDMLLYQWREASYESGQGVASDPACSLALTPQERSGALSAELLPTPLRPASGSRPRVPRALQVAASYRHPIVGFNRSGERRSSRSAVTRRREVIGSEEPLPVVCLNMNQSNKWARPKSRSHRPRRRSLS